MSDEEWKVIRDKLQLLGLCVAALSLGVFFWAFYDWKHLLSFACGLSCAAGVINLLLPKSLAVALKRHREQRTPHTQQERVG
jgi:hypothetical protein